MNRLDIFGECFTGIRYRTSLFSGSLPENEAVRKRIIEAVNELKVDPNTSDEVKKVLIATFP